LRDTLHDLVDFDLLNSGAVRCSVGAVQVETGNMKYFDTSRDVIGPEHIMASGALPPGFPPVLIDGQPYWDGGIVSNTPLQYVLDRGGPRQDMCVFQIDLFSAKGTIPQTLFDVTQREKDIRYSSRTRLNTDAFRQLQTIRRVVRRLEAKIPADIKDSFDWHLLSEVGCDAAITIVHLIHRRAVYEHWRDGIDDVKRTLSHPNWLNRKRPEEGVAVLDLTKELDPLPIRKSHENL
jgi:NTE family protein